MSPVHNFFTLTLIMKCPESLCVREFVMTSSAAPSSKRRPTRAKPRAGSATTTTPRAIYSRVTITHAVMKEEERNCTAQSSSEVHERARKGQRARANWASGCVKRTRPKVTSLPTPALQSCGALRRTQRDCERRTFIPSVGFRQISADFLPRRSSVLCSDSEAASHHKGRVVVLGRRNICVVI